MKPSKTLRSLGEGLVEERLLSREQLQQAQGEAAQKKLSLRQAILRLKLLTDQQLAQFVAQSLHLPLMELAHYQIDPQAITKVPYDLARQWTIMPLFLIADRLTVAMADPLDVRADDALRQVSGGPIERVVATESDILAAIDAHYGISGEMDQLIKAIEQRLKGLPAEGEVDVKQLTGLAEEPTIVRLVNLLIQQALRARASDIHIEPEAEQLRIRFRVDGVLREQSAPPKFLHRAICSRVKILANMDIAERRMPQDGAFPFQATSRTIDVRVSSMPTIHGENLVLRLLDHERLAIPLASLGMATEWLARYQKLIQSPWGILLITGPTGCGKTTTLYASLRTINTVERNIVTIEDPVEYQLPMVRQTQVNPKAGVTFASGLRSILRQDPDVIMVGEIRDRETAEIAIHAALTGHLVFSTLHTNDAPGALTRLVEMGIEPFLVTSSVLGVVAQRLVRLICQECRGQGCHRCQQSGFLGRMGLFELMEVTPPICEAVMKRQPAEVIRQLALAGKMRPLKEDGRAKVAQGLTTEEELAKVVSGSD